MNWDTALPFIAALTQDLVPASGTTQDQLIEAQKYIAKAVLNGQEFTSFGLLYSPDVSSLPRVDDPSKLEYLKPQFLPISSAPSCLRRDFSIKASPDPRTNYTIAAGQDAWTFGPFLDGFGRPVAVDVISTASVYSANFPGAEPYLYTTRQIDNAGVFEGGGVWIAARQFVPSAPADSFVGLKVLKGQLVSQPGPAAKLTIQLAEAVFADDSVFSMSPPQKVSFLFRQSTNRATLVSGSSTEGNLLIFGEHIKLQHQQNAAFYDSLSASINFPMQADKTNFKVNQGEFKSAVIRGAMTTTKAAWSLPLVIWSHRTFTEPFDFGGYAFFIDPGLSILPVARQDEVFCGSSVLTLNAAGICVTGTAANSANKSMTVMIASQETSANSRSIPNTVPDKSYVTLRVPGPFSYRFIAQSDGSESWSFLPNVSASFDQPRDVNNSRIPFLGPAYNVFIYDRPTESVSYWLESRQVSTDNPKKLSFAIQNLFFKTDTFRHLIMTGIYANNNLHTGNITLRASLQYTLPILPDPYATNILPNNSLATIARFRRPLIFKLTWSENDVDVDAHTTRFKVDILSSSSFSIGQTLNVESPENPRNPRDYNDVLGGIAERYGVSLETGPVLLDLSSNACQLGVAPDYYNSSSVISNLALESPLQNIRIFALPAVQWEPITLLNKDGTYDSTFAGNKYEFPYSGPFTSLQSKSITLTPVTPRAAIEQVVADYNKDLSNSIAALFSLPFGVVAIVQASGAGSGLQQAPIIDFERPEFERLVPIEGFDTSPEVKSIRGIEQISIQTRQLMQTPINSTGSDTSPSLLGAAIPLYMNLNDSTEHPKSVMGPIIPQVFQNDFQRKVPLTRIDLSGYGESVFSDWSTSIPAGAVGISKVDFRVFSGRAAREVVEMVSICLPYKFRVVRTITIERVNSSAVFRRDSGWQAVSDGNYKIPGSNEHETHPGVVLGVSRVVNIRDIDSTVGDLVTFDCLVRLQDGEGFIDVPVRDQVGYVITGSIRDSTPGGPMAYAITMPDSSKYANKIFQYPLGGPIDATIRIGKSGMVSRITNITVSPCRKDMTNAVQFAMAAWGSPVLPGGGQWSFARTIQDGTVQAVDRLKGVPIIREGLNPALISDAIPYHFAEPIDLLKLADPNQRLSAARNTVYSIIHAAESHRLMFPDPALLLDQGVKGVTSLLPPQLADSFALGTSTGIFPDLANCIPLREGDLPDPKQLLQFVGGDNLLLKLENTPLKDITRELQKDANTASLVRTAGKIGTDLLGNKIHVPSELNLIVDTASKIQNLDLANLSMIAMNEAKQEVNRVIGDIKSAVGKELTQFINSSHIFGEALEEVKKVVSFLDSLGVLPPLKVSMTNEWAMEISTGMGLKEFLEKIKDPATRAVMAKFIADFELAIMARCTLSEAKFKLKMGVTIKVDSGFGLMALGVAGFELGISTSTGLSLSLDLGVGIGITFTIGPFGASAYYSQTQTIMKGQNKWGVGATAVLKAHVDLVVATADLCLEAKLMLLGGTCHDDEPESTIWAWAQVSIALDVSIFWVVNVSVHESAEWSNCLKDGASGRCSLEALRG